MRFVSPVFCPLFPFAFQTEQTIGQYFYCSRLTYFVIVSQQLDLYIAQSNANVGQSSCEMGFGAFGYSNSLHEVVRDPAPGYPVNSTKQSALLKRDFTNFSKLNLSSITVSVSTHHLRVESSMEKMAAIPVNMRFQPRKTYRLMYNHRYTRLQQWRKTRFQ